MPCRYYTDGEEAAIRAANSLADEQEIDDLTAMLCSTCRLLKRNGLLIEKSEVGKWYAAHQEMDKKRIAAERKEKSQRRAAAKLKQDALAKLTPEEQAALGINEEDND